MKHIGMPVAGAANTSKSAYRVWYPKGLGPYSSKWPPAMFMQKATSLISLWTSFEQAQFAGVALTPTNHV